MRAVRRGEDVAASGCVNRFIQVDSLTIKALYVFVFVDERCAAPFTARNVKRFRVERERMFGKRKFIE